MVTTNCRLYLLAAPSLDLSIRMMRNKRTAHEAEGAADAENVNQNEKSEYELQRENRMEQNASFLQTLGLDQPAAPAKATKAPRAKKAKGQTAPARASNRARGVGPTSPWSGGGVDRADAAHARRSPCSTRTSTREGPPG